MNTDEARRQHVLNNDGIYTEFVRESRAQRPYTPLVQWITENRDRVDADMERAARLVCDYCRSIEAMTGLRNCPIHSATDEDVARSHGRPANTGDPNASAATCGEPDCVFTDPEPGPEALSGEADPEYRARIDARGCTLEFAQRLGPADCGQLPLADSPLFGGRRQGSLFE